MMPVAGVRLTVVVDQPVADLLRHGPGLRGGTVPAPRARDRRVAARPARRSAHLVVAAAVGIDPARAPHPASTAARPSPTTPPRSTWAPPSAASTSPACASTRCPPGPSAPSCAASTNSSRAARAARRAPRIVVGARRRRRRARLRAPGAGSRARARQGPDHLLEQRAPRAAGLSPDARRAASSATPPRADRGPPERARGRGPPRPRAARHGRGSPCDALVWVAGAASVGLFREAGGLPTDRTGSSACAPRSRSTDTTISSRSATARA